MELGEPLKTRLISVSLGIIAVLSIFQGYISNTLALPSNWYVPIMLGALAIILEATVGIRRVESRFDSIVNDSELSPTKVYHDYDQLFRDATGTLVTTRGDLKLSHVKTEPPSSFNSEDVNEFHQETLQWCEENPSCQLKRIITVSNEEMFEWAEKLADTSEKYSNFYVRVCQWQSEFDMVNPAIYGEEEIYFALSLDTPEALRGIYIRDPEVVEVYERYFDAIWHSSEPIEDFVRNHSNQYKK